jgi:hypothetical protein
VQPVAPVPSSAAAHVPPLVRTTNPGQVPELLAQGATAVVLERDREPIWLTELGGLVEDGIVNIRRTVLNGVGSDDVTRWLRGQLTGVPDRVAGPLLDDVNAMTTRILRLGAAALQVRAFTETPTRRCGYHVDTVPPDAAVIGAVCGYNGAGTEYVDPLDVIGMRRFFDYLATRERLARQEGSPSVDQQLRSLDDEPAFLRAGAPVHHTRPGDQVYFCHVDISRMWTDLPAERAWVHRSPMSGTRRFVVNVSPASRVGGK